MKAMRRNWKLEKNEGLFALHFLIGREYNFSLVHKTVIKTRQNVLYILYNENKSTGCSRNDCEMTASTLVKIDK